MQEKEYIEIGVLDSSLFDKIGQTLVTNEVIFTYERMNHVETKRFKLFEEIQDILPKTLFNPDYIYKDWNNRKNTLILIKSINKNSNLNVVLRLAMINDAKHPKNSIITIIKIGKKTLNKIIKNKHDNLLFKNLDKYE